MLEADQCWMPKLLTSFATLRLAWRLTSKSVAAEIWLEVTAGIHNGVAA
jgi:hypothetical protein